MEWKRGSHKTDEGGRDRRKKLLKMTDKNRQEKNDTKERNSEENAIRYDDICIKNQSNY